MRIRLIFVIFIGSLLLYTGCAAVKNQNNAEEQLYIKTLSEGIEKHDTPEPPKLLGGWEDVSLNDSEALFYYSEAVKEIEKNENFLSDPKLRCVRRQIVAGTKYYYLAETAADRETVRAEIIILVHFDGSYEILEYDFNGL